MSKRDRQRLCQFENDILFVLEKAEPGALLWREIKARLELVHQPRYKDDKSYGVALSNYLARLDGKFIKKFGDDHWGTLKSCLPKKLEKGLQTEEKPHPQGPPTEDLVTLYGLSLLAGDEEMRARVLQRISSKRNSRSTYIILSFDGP